ncbi:hypothetical protein, variant [Aphanomyces invadans]|nr:hypothetical protein, variant [Aphanomyces invadans]ETW01021.1 hypothetical protein, variant [Aphanomyces invadans]|eukprot:XP_008870019.1 hypothetical protein, variant [Aphanomyces invadans]
MLHAKIVGEPEKDKPLTVRPSSRKNQKAHTTKNQSQVEQSDDDSVAETYGVSVIPGLANLGNSCYFNSTIQALKAVFLPQLLKQAVAKEHGRGPITQALMDFILDGTTLPATKIKGKRVYNPSTLLTEVREKCRQFRNRAQQDAYEMLLALVWAIDDEFIAASKATAPSPPSTAQPKPSIMEQIFVKTDADTLSLMVPQGSSVEEIQKLVAKQLRLNEDDLFVAGPPQPSIAPDCGSVDNFVWRAMMGCLVNTVVCQSCNSTSKTFDACISITVSIPKDVNACTIEDALAAFTAPGVLSEAHGCGYTCDHCNAISGSSQLRTAAIQMQLHTPAPILVLHLKRLTRLKKNTLHVAFSTDLDVAPYLSQPPCGPQLPTTYSLHAVVVHSGNRFGGHYVAYVKHGGQWFVTSDTSVKEVSEATVLQAEAYLLFYKWIY